MKIGPIENKSLVRAVTDKIINLIKRGELKPGEKLPPQRSLAKQLNVGMGCVREGIQALSHLQIVDVLPGKGVYVSKNFSIESMLNPVRIVMPLEKVTSDKLIELWNARMLLERGSVTDIIENIDEDEVRELERIYKNMVNLLEEEELDSYNPEDLKFHSVLIKSTHNSVLEQLHKFIYEILLEVFKTKISSLEIAKKSLKGHKIIINGIKNRDKEYLDNALKKHIEVSKSDVLKTFNDNLSNKHL